MSVQHVATYTCDRCGKKCTGQADSKKGDKWFTIIIKVFNGCDKKDTTQQHVCGFKCANTAMVEHDNASCIKWVKMEELFY